MSSEIPWGDPVLAVIAAIYKHAENEWLYETVNAVNSPRLEAELTAEFGFPPIAILPV